MGKKLTQEEVIKRFEEVHGNKYDYSKVVYNGINKKVVINCPEHEEFLQTPNNHFKYGCFKCGMNNLGKPVSQHIKDFKKIHFDKYDYSKINFKNTMTKIEIICPEHGSFWQTPLSHKSGNGCPKCAKEKQRIDTKEFLNSLPKDYFNKYDYSKTKYVNRFKKIEVICKNCGKSFWCIPNNHLKGTVDKDNTYCPNCYINKNTYSQERIIKDFKKVHSDYDYSLVKYINTMTKVQIICKKCKCSFWQKPNDHKMGAGCPNCKRTKGEKRIGMILEENNINFIREYRFKDCKYKNTLPFDFYLPELNILIEYDGKQHYEPVPHFGGEKAFQETQERDKIKTEYCLENNIELIRIPYWNFYNIEEVLKPVITGSRELVQR